MQPVSKEMRIHSKTGVSPLIATFLLVMFAVALGFVVVTWGSDFDIEAGEDASCGAVKFEIPDIEGYEICMVTDNTSEYINFVLQNSGSEPITGFDIWLIGQKGTKLSTINSLNFQKEQTLHYTQKDVVYDEKQYGALEQVQFIPKIGNPKVSVCAQRRVTATRSGVCLVT